MSCTDFHSVAQHHSSPQTPLLPFPPSTKNHLAASCFIHDVDSLCDAVKQSICDAKPQDYMQLYWESAVVPVLEEHARVLLAMYAGGGNSSSKVIPVLQQMVLSQHQQSVAASRVLDWLLIINDIMDKTQTVQSISGALLKIIGQDAS